MPPTSSRSQGLSVTGLVEMLGAGLLTVVHEGSAEVIDDITLAEPRHRLYGQPGDLLLGVAIERAGAAADLVTAAAGRHVHAVALRAGVARHPEVVAAAERAGSTLVAVGEQVSWAHLVWLVRGVLDRVAVTGRTGGEDLFALAEACAALVDAPVTIEDTGSRILAHSSRQEQADPIRVSSIVGRRVPENVLRTLRAAGVFRRLARSTAPFFVPAAPDGSLRPRLVVPVWAAGEWLGSIWAVVEERPPEAVVRSLEQTATVVALHLLFLRSQTDLARRLLGDRLRALISGAPSGPDDWVPPGPWRAVVLVTEPGQDAERALDTWESVCRRSAWREPLLAVLDGQVVGLVTDVRTEEPADTGRGSAAGSWRWLAALVAEDDTEQGAAAGPPRTRSHEESGRSVDALRAVAGARVSDLDELPRSLAEALEVRRAATRPRAVAALTVEDAWAAVTLERAVGGIGGHGSLSGTGSAIEYGPAAVLATHDRHHGTAFAPTVAAWLDHPGDPRAASERLHIHPNTLRYRLGQVRDILGETQRALDDPADRLALRLQLLALGHRPPARTGQ